MSLRIKLIQKIIEINEMIFFYPKLKRFYKSKLSGSKISIIDVSATKGQTIDFFLSLNKYSIIDSFEPNKKLYNNLVKKYSKNKNIKIHNFGISNIYGELIFNENILDETSTFESLNLESKYLSNKAKILGVNKEKLIVSSYNVKVIKLVDFLNKDYDVLKIDVKGHELECLEGLFVNKDYIPIRFIQLENHQDDMYEMINEKKSKIISILNLNNFFLVAEVKHGFGGITELIYENTKYYEA
jgi:FkbM family methyltransferase